MFWTLVPAAFSLMTCHTTEQWSFRTECLSHQRHVSRVPVFLLTLMLVENLHAPHCILTWVSCCQVVLDVCLVIALALTFP